MKRQETLRSSSSRRSTPCRTNTDRQHQSHHVKSNVGCMTGILQLVQSKYQTRRKFLTFGKKQNKQQQGVSVSLSPAPIPSKKTEAPVPIPPPTPAKPGAETTAPSTPPKITPQKHKDVMSMKLAAAKSDGSRELCRSPCEAQLIVPRSPPLPADIRRSQANATIDDDHLSTPDRTRCSQNNRRSPPALVARLMGLDEVPTSSHPLSSSSAAPSTPDRPSASEKRRKLLGALEKCDEDLKTLRKVIEDVRSERRVQTPRKDKVVVESPSPGGEKSGNGCSLLASDENDHEVPPAVKLVDEEYRKKGSGGVNSCDGNNQEERSPVSVLDHDVTQSSPASSCSSGGYNRKIMKGKGEVLLQQEQVQQQQQQYEVRKKGEVKHIISRHCFVSKPIDIQPLRSDPKKIDRVPVFPPGSSRAMVETVDEVCKDISLGQRREVGIIGLLVQDGIFRDLVDEVLEDLGGRRRRRRLHSFESCKRKLCF